MNCDTLDIYASDDDNQEGFATSETYSSVSYEREAPDSSDSEGMKILMKWVKRTNVYDNREVLDLSDSCSSVDSNQESLISSNSCSDDTVGEYETSYYCPSDGDYIISKKKSNHQKPRKSKNQKYKCNHKDCGKLLSSKSSLLNHQKLHLGINPFTCDEVDLKGLKAHREIHANDYHYQCDKCGKGFMVPYRLRQHIKFRREPDCKKTFIFAPHTGEKQYRCKEPGCRKSFMRSNILVRHRRIHTSERPYECKEPGCGKSYIQWSYLQRHMISHTGEPPYRCDVSGCEMSFSRSFELKEHIKFHTGEPSDDNNSRSTLYHEKDHVLSHNVSKMNR